MKQSWDDSNQVFILAFQPQWSAIWFTVVQNIIGRERPGGTGENGGMVPAGFENGVDLAKEKNNKAHIEM